MKTVKKNVYYCDFCKKRGLSSFYMKKHERHCTANPNRECGVCGNNPDIKPIIEQLKARFEIVDATDDLFTPEKVNYFGEEITLDEVMDLVDGCPACTLAVLRQTKLHYDVVGFNFNYNVELAVWYRGNGIRYDEDYY